MTQIIIRKDQGFLIASDNTLVMDNTKHDEVLLDNETIFINQLDNQVVYMVPSNFKIASLLKVSDDIKPKTNEKLTLKYMVSSFIRNLYGELIDAGYIINDGKYPHFDSEIIIAKNDKAFLVYKTGVVEEINQVTIVGEGKEIASALYSTSPYKDELKTIAYIFKNLSVMGRSTSSHITLLDTSTKESKISRLNIDDLNKILL